MLSESSSQSDENNNTDIEGLDQPSTSTATSGPSLQKKDLISIFDNIIKLVPRPVTDEALQTILNWVDSRTTNTNSLSNSLSIDYFIANLFCAYFTSKKINEDNITPIQNILLLFTKNNNFIEDYKITEDFECFFNDLIKYIKNYGYDDLLDLDKSYKKLSKNNFIPEAKKTIQKAIWSLFKETYRDLIDLLLDSIENKDIEVCLKTFWNAIYNEPILHPENLYTYLLLVYQYKLTFHTNKSIDFLAKMIFTTKSPSFEREFHATLGLDIENEFKDFLLIAWKELPEGGLQCKNKEIQKYYEETKNVIEMSGITIDLKKKKLEAIKKITFYIDSLMKQKKNKNSVVAKADPSRIKIYTPEIADVTEDLPEKDIKILTLKTAKEGGSFVTYKSINPQYSPDKSELDSVLPSKENKQASEDEAPKADNTAGQFSAEDLSTNTDGIIKAKATENLPEEDPKVSTQRIYELNGVKNFPIHELDNPQNDPEEGELGAAGNENEKGKEFSEQGIKFTDKELYRRLETFLIEITQRLKNLETHTCLLLEDKSFLERIREGVFFGKKSLKKLNSSIEQKSSGILFKIAIKEFFSKTPWYKLLFNYGIIFLPWKSKAKLIDKISHDIATRICLAKLNRLQSLLLSLKITKNSFNQLKIDEKERILSNHIEYTRKHVNQMMAMDENVNIFLHSHELTTIKQQIDDLEKFKKSYCTSNSNSSHSSSQQQKENITPPSRVKYFVDFKNFIFIFSKKSAKPENKPSSNGANPSP